PEIEKETPMETKRSHIILAGALLLATALVGVGLSCVNEPSAATPKGQTKYTAPSGGPVSFGGTLDRSSVLVGGDGLARMELVIAAPAQPAVVGERKPTDLMIVLDRSGSMSGDKIEQARAAVLQLVAQLGPQDRFALVTYSDSAQVALPLSPVDER